jgi:hypothetical protein
MPFFLPWLTSGTEVGQGLGHDLAGWQGARRRPVLDGGWYIGQNGEGTEGVQFPCSP